MTKLEILRSILKRSIFVAAVTLIVSISTWASAGAIEVAIDVKPMSDPNCFNNNGHGVIPVAILGDEAFDPTEVDGLTLVFRPSDGTGDDLFVKVKRNGDPLCGVDDVNGDGFLDFVCHFEDEEGAFPPGTVEADIVGELFDGTQFDGFDSVCIVP